MDFEWGDTERMLMETTRHAVDRAIEPVLAAHPCRPTAAQAGDARYL